ncbi:MAG: TonB-dependent receptor [Chitinophaga sp.]|uniref:SusC/RagA family TonB-linked outer membrane protein n=1 Tax=Chitinophaga sp. TaxID=1869181 RepID=UPI001B1D6F64|nr:TonB-dependent receptor [Chitinophaga sp.]MBO9730928.1 TonB-dependent receptor [Chitinophaga sp.]
MLQRLLLVLLLFSAPAVFAQTRTVTGRVYSAKDNTPLPGASVVIKGTTNGTATDADGNFKLSVNDPAATTLQIRFIGMESQEVPISTRPLNIALRSSGKDLGEIEIVVAYGTTKKGSYTGSVSQIKGTELENRQVSSVSKALQGLAAGVQSTSTSGQPGSDATIRIRGVGSINASADPLYVLDGVPYSGSLSAINPSDIESISVLKDATSSALYGSRGANGVIIITTKKGRQQGSVINARVSQGFSKRAVKDYEKVTTDQYFEMYWEALRNGALTNGASPTAAAAQASNRLISRVGINPYGTAFPQPVGTDGKLVAGAKALWDDDWDKAMQQTGHRTQADLSISGATDKSRYYISGGYLNDQGIYLASGFKRYNVRSNVELDAKKWLKVGLNIGGAHSDQQAPPSEDSRTDNYVNYGRLMASFYPIYQRDRTTGAYLLDANGNKMFDYGSYRPSAANTNSNLIGTAPIDKHNYGRDDVSARVYGEATILPGLKFKTSYNADYTATNQHDYTNPTFGFDAEVGGTVEKNATRVFSWTFNNILTYDHTFNEKHHLNVLAGQETYKYTTTFMDGQRSGFSLLGLDELSDAALIKDLQGYTDTYNIYSYLGRAEYDYLGKYFLSGSLRADRSSRFDPRYAWGTFWSLGASWKLTEEDFLKGSSWLNLLTLRASYGAQGNDNLGEDSYYNYLPLLNVNSNLGEGGTYRRILYNDKLKWETNLNLNVGVDYAMFDNRFSGTLEFFQRASKNLLYLRPLPPSMGYSSIAENIGALKNTGFEVTLHGVPVKTKDFSWTVDLNLTHYKNKVTELPQKEIISGTKKLMVGHSIYDFWIRDWAGVDEKTGLPLWYINNPDGTKGKTSNSAAASLYYSKSSLPDLYGGFTNTFNYKDFSLSFMWAYSLGGSVLDNDYLYLLGTGTSAGRSFGPEMLNHWTPQNTKTDVPKLTTVQTNWTATSNRFLYDASYARLKNVNLSYNLPKSLMERAHLNNVTVYLQGDNLFTLYKHKGLDPEQSVGGTTYYRYPAIKSLSAGINLSF